MNTGKYILNEAGEVVAEPDLLKWGTWFEDSGDTRRVALTRVGEIEVSTIFLGMDHNWSKKSHQPVLWETMVFGGRLDNEQERYISKQDAILGHIEMVERVKEGA